MHSSSNLCRSGIPIAARLAVVCLLAVLVGCSSSRAGNTNSGGGGGAANPSTVNVLTYHNDNARTGQNLNETVLTTSNVTSNTFGKLGTMPVTSNVDAEPLYASHLTINGAAHNVVFVATEADLVYAFDADTFSQLWSVSVADGEAPPTAPGQVDNCSQVQPEIGVTATPVIDLSAGDHGTIFVVAMTRDSGGNYHQRLHGLDLATGNEQANSPAEINATYTIPGTSTNVTFNPMQYEERTGLLLVNGSIYLAWASHCDVDPYEGWLMAYSESSLQQTAVLNITPAGIDSRGSIWMANSAMAADSSGNIYFLAANGIFGDGSSSPPLTPGGFPASGDYGNAFMKISTAGGLLSVADYFAMFNANNESAEDEDLGSGGAIVLPDLPDAESVTRHLAVGAGKDGYIYVVNRDSMGKYNPDNDAAIYQKLNDPNGNATGSPALGGQVFSMPAYFNNTVYYGASNDVVRAFPIANAKLAAQPSSTTAVSFGHAGCTPSVSANSASNGIVWCIYAQASQGILYAFNASNLGQELYDSSQSGSRDQFADNNSDKFVTPLVANGKVYVGTPTGVVVFGLLQ